MINTILAIVAIAAIVTSIISFKKYSKLLVSYNILQSEQDNLIENTVILRNAVYEGYLYAEETQNDFEMKAYKKLLKELKGEG